MLLGTPFRERVAPLCRSGRWRSWSGFAAAASYETGHEAEYYAVRSGAALFGVSPLRKYEISGRDAPDLVDRIFTRDARSLAPGGALYTPLCDDDGKLVDDGTVQRLETDVYRVTTADPCLRWFQDCALGMDAAVRDVSDDLAALALQGPTSRDVLGQVVTGVDVGSIEFFGVARAFVGSAPVAVTRTGYTGDLGYEIWAKPVDALALWDALFEAGSDRGPLPAGLDALDVARIEAGLLLKETDYVSSWTALTESRKSSPYEAGLGWAVQPRAGRRPFVGQSALERERRNPSARALVGLEVDWSAIEERFAAVGLPPLVAGRASRAPTPIFAPSRRASGRQVGHATSSAFSPILKKCVALATIQRPLSRPGQRVDVELTVEFARHRVPARVVRTPFFDPARRKGGVDASSSSTTVRAAAATPDG